MEMAIWWCRQERDTSADKENAQIVKSTEKVQIKSHLPKSKKPKMAQKTKKYSKITENKKNKQNKQFIEAYIKGRLQLTSLG